MKSKFTGIQAALGIPMLFLAATHDDKYRKPSLGMVNHVESTYFKINRAESFYCGDAAGRPATETRKKDFSADDLKFAWNQGVKFETPESLFLNQPQTGV